MRALTASEKEASKFLRTRG